MQRCKEKTKIVFKEIGYEEVKRVFPQNYAQSLALANMKMKFRYKQKKVHSFATIVTISTRGHLISLFYVIVYIRKTVTKNLFR